MVCKRQTVNLADNLELRELRERVAMDNVNTVLNGDSEESCN